MWRHKQVEIRIETDGERFTEGPARVIVTLPLAGAVPVNDGFVTPNELRRMLEGGSNDPELFTCSVERRDGEVRLTFQAVTR